MKLEKTILRISRVFIAAVISCSFVFMSIGSARAETTEDFLNSAQTEKDLLVLSDLLNSTWDNLTNSLYYQPLGEATLHIVWPEIDLFYARRQMKFMGEKWTKNITEYANRQNLDPDVYLASMMDDAQPWRKSAKSVLANAGDVMDKVDVVLKLVEGDVEGAFIVQAKNMFETAAVATLGNVALPMIVAYEVTMASFFAVKHENHLIKKIQLETREYKKDSFLTNMDTSLEERAKYFIKKYTTMTEKKGVYGSIWVRPEMVKFFQEYTESPVGMQGAIDLEPYFGWFGEDPIRASLLLVDSKTGEPTSDFLTVAKHLINGFDTVVKAQKDLVARRHLAKITGINTAMQIAFARRAEKYEPEIVEYAKKLDMRRKKLEMMDDVRAQLRAYDLAYGDVKEATTQEEKRIKRGIEDARDEIEKYRGSLEYAWIEPARQGARANLETWIKTFASRVKASKEYGLNFAFVNEYINYLRNYKVLRSLDTEEERVKKQQFLEEQVNNHLVSLLTVDEKLSKLIARKEQLQEEIDALGRGLKGIEKAIEESVARDAEKWQKVMDSYNDPIWDHVAEDPYAF
ncbi:MAG: hypothetical protein NUV49_02805 [Patescibacteria group bacterium]|nr:hypothetical protein [Patescibacteria group bacterium]